MEILIANSAFHDLESISAYYIEQGVPHIGKEFLASIIDHIQILMDHPDIGRIVPEFDQPSIREMIHPPFRIVYLRELEVIKVIRIWRSERLLSLATIED